MNAIFTVFVLLACAGASAAAPLDSQLRGVEIEQKLGAAVPLALTFRDETGRAVRFGDYFGSRPTLLALVYYGCPNLCTVTLNGLVEGVRALTLETGRDYDILVVSIDPSETAALAAEKKHTYTMRYGRPGSAKGWHFLTGDAASIRQLAEAVGFRYFYEPATKQFAHASGIMVLTPSGKVSRYFLGIEYPPRDLRLALVEASQSRIGSVADRLLLLCFHYNPLTGRYGLLITRVVQIAGLSTVAALAGLILLMQRRARKRALPTP
jgi:protein SCO1/2